MRFTYIATITFLLLPAGTSFAQENQYVEVYTAKVRQDRVAEFGALAGRIADANRKSGDTFIALSDFYGKDNRVSFASGRESAAEVDVAMGKFMGSLKEHLGWTPDRFMAEWSKTVESGQSELRRRRPDLSSNIPDSDAWMKNLGASRYLMTVALHVKPGRNIDTEKQLAMIKHAGEQATEKRMVSISQLVAGQSGSVYYVTIPMKAIGDLDAAPTLRKTLGDEAFERYMESAAQNYEAIEYRVLRVVPEWSNAPKTIADVDPKFWNTRVMVAKPKAKPTTTEPKPAS